MRSSPAAAGLFLILATFAACGRREQAQGLPAPQVSVAQPLRQTVIDWDDFVGRFGAEREVDVRARASGYIQAVHFEDGQVVQSGQLLFTLDPRPAQAQLDIARSQNALAQADFRRAQTLLSADAISKEEFDTRRSTARQAAATQRARALDVEFTRVTAPISGLASDRRVDPGNLIAGGTSAGDVLTTIVAVNPIYFYFDASEALFLKYQRVASSGRAPTVRVRLLDEADYRWEGWLDFTDNALNPGSGTIRLRAVLLNPRSFLRPGLIGHARLEGSRAYVALLVPDKAIVTDGSRRVVYVVGANNRVQSKPVALGPLSGDLRVIRSGVSASDRVVVNGVQRARPGLAVAPRQVRIAPSAPQPQAPPAMRAPASVATPVPYATSSAGPSRPAASKRQMQGSAASSDSSVRGR
jgi:RND family efflux transporter MFP subunit